MHRNCGEHARRSRFFLVCEKISFWRFRFDSRELTRIIKKKKKKKTYARKKAKKKDEKNGRKGWTKDARSLEEKKDRVKKKKRGGKE